MNQSKPEDSISLEGSIDAKALRRLRAHSGIETLSLSKQRLVTAEIAKGFSDLKSVRHLWLSCPVTRTAMRHVISIPGLEALEIQILRHPGRLAYFAQAVSLRVFRCLSPMSEADLLEIANLPALAELGAEYSTLSPRALDALLRIPKLRRLNLEGTDFDDQMALTLSASKTLRELDVGISRLTALGLERICKMTELRYLDIWAIDIVERDLQMLAQLSKLEYLSIGTNVRQPAFTSTNVLPCLEKLASLKQIWLDGIPLTEGERKMLEERYEHVQYTLA